MAQSMPMLPGTSTLLEEVLKGNGEEHLVEKIMEVAIDAENYPSVIFDWENVHVFVQSFQTAEAQAAAPGGLPLPADPNGLPAAGVNVENFKKAVLEYERVPGAEARLGTTCLPCSLAQCSQRIIAVGVPNSLPIAGVYVPRPRSNALDRATDQLPNSVWG